MTLRRGPLHPDVPVLTGQELPARPVTEEVRWLLVADATERVILAIAELREARAALKLALEQARHADTADSSVRMYRRTE